MSTAPVDSRMCRSKLAPVSRLADPPLSGVPTNAHSEGHCKSSFERPGPAGAGSNSRSSPEPNWYERRGSCPMLSKW